MATKRERVLQVAQRVHELRAELARLESELDEMVGEGAEARDAAQDSLPNRIVAVLEHNPAQSYTAPDLVQALGIEQQKIDQVRSALFRLKAASRIRKVHKGKFRSLAKHKTDPALSVVETEQKAASN